MSFISGFLNQTAKLYSIDATTAAASGQPIETLVYLRDIKVYFSSNPRQIFQLFGAGQVPIGQFTAISVEETETNQILEINDVKYRIEAANPASFKNRTFAYINYLARFQH